jgi:poly(A) polymerase
LKLGIEPEALSLLSGVYTILKRNKIQTYLVGGLVRDTLLGRKTGDIDIAVAADALELAPEIAGALNGNFVLLDKENRVARIVLPGKTTGVKQRNNLDLSTIAGSIADDLARRDFTVDAMAVDVAQLLESAADVALIDPHRGREDLKKKVIRAVSAEVFTGDAVRLIRSVRLAAELGFSIENDTEALIRRQAPLISGVPGEKIREELLRILALPRAGYFIRELDRLGLLTAFIPELLPARGLAQPKEHVWDVFDHSLETVAAADFLLRTGEWPHAGKELLEVVPWSDKIARHFSGEVSSGSTRGSLLKLSALLHDIAKPQTRTLEADGRMRFLGHPEEGARVALNILERLRFSNKEMKQVELTIKHHMRVVQMSDSGMPSSRAIYRYFRDTGDAGIDTIFLSLADHLAARGPTLCRDEWEKHAREMDYVLRQRFQKEEMLSPTRLLDGHEVMTVFGLKPGPRIGQILEEIREAQATGELSTREQALSYIREHLLYERCEKR